jgi:DNA-binding transcriptional MerR regulator
MKMLIKDFAKACGVSVRTLHYYDEIGLLKPSFVDEWTGYRYYDENSLLRMQEIMFYRELDFSLKNISQIISSPYYDKEKALSQQKKLLILKKERLEKLIFSIDDAMKGKVVMNAFDNSEFEKYKDEAKEKWGNTTAYAEYSEKSKNYGKDKFSAISGEMAEIFSKFNRAMKNSDADSDEAQALVKELQDYITNNFYTCTKEILSGLGQMYVYDERFKNNIDKAGEGTAEFVSEAIKIYCK